MNYGAMQMPAHVNPFSGPAYWVTLKNSLERNGESTRRPRTGGEQISLRLDDHPLNHINAIAGYAGWNRSEVLTAIIECGLFRLYEHLNEDTQNNLIQKIVEETQPLPKM
jgi:hypothetical protein